MQASDWYDAVLTRPDDSPAAEQVGMPSLEPIYCRRTVPDHTADTSMITTPT